MNCASSFRGLHEAVLNHTNGKPEILTCPHEEIAVAMAHGYAKLSGKPIGDDLPRHGRPTARDDGDLQRVVRPDPGLRDDRQHHRR